MQDVPVPIPGGDDPEIQQKRDIEEQKAHARKKEHNPFSEQEKHGEEAQHRPPRTEQEYQGNKVQPRLASSDDDTAENVRNEDQRKSA
jgi:alpha-D-ribose 1-methylphosphonate 5-triphosphate diphosphatase PhnM